MKDFNQKIILKNVRVNNLRSVNLQLDPNQLIVFTGVSGSGKSSLAFDTLFVEGQRRYIESLSHFAKRQMGDLNKPDMEAAYGISPTISIEQKTAGKNPRSTVGTLTEVYDYLRVLFARIAVPHCPVSHEAVRPQSRERIIRTVQGYPDKTKLVLLAPYARGKKAEFKEDFDEILRKGFTRVRVDGNIVHLDEEISLDGSVAHDVDIVVDRIVVSDENKSRIADSLTQALNLGEGIASAFFPDSDEEELFSMHAYSPGSGISYRSLEPHDFSFNSPSGMCPRCHGLGEVNDFVVDKIIDPDKSIAEDCCSIATSYQTVRYGNIYDNLARIFGFSVDKPWKKLSKEARNIFLYGAGDKWLKMIFVHPRKSSTWIDRIKWKGVLHEARQRFQEAKTERYRKNLSELMHRQVCPECEGKRLKPYPAAAKLKGKTVSDITKMTIGECSDFFQALSLSDTEKTIALEVVKEVRERLDFLLQVGLHYLTLDRTAPTLSGGEAQRVRLASQIGCGLVGITYILDEPSIGLHPRDNKKLIETLKHLRDMGNTVIVVEHDEETILEADAIVDFGPLAGSNGGEVLIHGSLKKLSNCKKSITSSYLLGKREIPIPRKRRKPNGSGIKIVGAKHNNLKNVSVKIPTEAFICVTGVSGSGKSSLITDTLYPALSNALHQGEQDVGEHRKIEGLDAIDKVIAIDQSPIGRNPRSNPATYIKLFDHIRDLFSELPASQAKGFQKGRFSFNVKEGSCSHCFGMGMVKIDMDFLEDAWSLCPLCKGKRFDEETLSVHYKGKTIFDILQMDVDEALGFFKNIPPISHKLETLKRVGLGYIKLGQFSTTLSGGEAQRVKLAKELVRPATGKTLYILDEPTTGLHFHDIKHLLDVLHELVDRGNTILVIEHNMDVVKTADWIIDLGPEGGKGGGEVVATGTPEKIAKMETPTGEAVEEALTKFFQTIVEQSLKKTAKKRKKSVHTKTIEVVGAEQNNLKQVDASIPRGKTTVCTGPSGSGKSSFVFDTIYAEGQRRYVESLSPYARQFVRQMPKPVVGHVEGLSPAIAIEQKIHAGNPRSTVGTMTEIYDYLRILFSQVGTPHCPETGEEIQSISKEVVADHILESGQGEKLVVMAPVDLKKKEPFEGIIDRFQRMGFLRIRLDGNYYSLDNEEEIPFDPKRLHELFLVIDRIKAEEKYRERLLEAIETSEKLSESKVVIEKEGEDHFYNLTFSVASTGRSYPEITPHTFSFNTLEGMCPNCEGLGFQYGANLTDNPEIMQASLVDLMEGLWGCFPSEKAFEYLFLLAEREEIDPLLPLKELPPAKLKLVMNGSSTFHQTKDRLRFRWVGLNTLFSHISRSKDTDLKKNAIMLMDEVTCFACRGARVNPLARNVTIKKKGIHDLTAMPVGETRTFLQNLSLNKEQKKLLEEVVLQLNNRLNFLGEVGLDYLSLNRSARTLSGGEAQRIRLARQLGSGLTGALYTLDEPTIGLHPEDNSRLNTALEKLKNLGNTLILVEHDPQTIACADYVLDFGPGAGANGGHITARGTLSQIKKNKHSLTGRYLTGKEAVPTPKKRRKNNQGVLKISNAAANNLKDISLSIPIGQLTCLTGVSGSGKSTLLDEVVRPAVKKGTAAFQNRLKLPSGTVTGIDHFDKQIVIDQNPIGHTVRSNVGTYVEVLDRMRSFFSQLPQAKANGLEPRHFSYNHRKGMCTNCWGLGYKRIEMHFLPPVRVKCDDCRGMRLNPVSLQVRYAGKNFGEYLQTTVTEARAIFKNHPRIIKILDTLIDVGLGYLRLGQEMQSLSGGEAQRIKLSRELAKRSTGKTLYLLDEPTTGLHPDDIKKLIRVLQRLVDKGNTMIIIEHNLDIIKNGDYLIELGPEAGEKGGSVIFSGTPEEMIKSRKSVTGKYLKAFMQKKR